MQAKRCIHLLVIIIALIESLTGVIIDCVLCTIFYPTSLENDVWSTSFYHFTAHLLPTKHFYRLIIVLYVPIYLWRSRGFGRVAEGTSDIRLARVWNRSRVFGVIYAQLLVPRHVLPATAEWLWQWFQALCSTSVEAPLAENSEAASGWQVWKQSTYVGLSGTPLCCGGEKHQSVIKQYSTRFALYRRVPWRLITRIYGTLTLCEVPIFLRRPFFRLYVWFFGCRLEEAAISDLCEYRSLSELFRRSLRPGVRPVDVNSDLTSPADGSIVVCGAVINGALEQIKGVSYSLRGFTGPCVHTLLSPGTAANPLLDTDCECSLLTRRDSRLYQCVVYLSPGEYHHFHSPADWVVTGRRHFPGELFSVNPAIVRWLQGLFCYNERVMYVGHWKHGFFSVTAVGATLVGSVDVPFDKELSAKKPVTQAATFSFHDHFFGDDLPRSSRNVGAHHGDEVGISGICLSKGDEMGDFRLGSTIVLLFEAPHDFMFSATNGQSVKYGEALASVY